MKKKDIFTVIRWGITLFLCIMVWKNAHWSVALAITMISLSIESMAGAIEIHTRAIKAQMQLYQDAVKDK